MRKVLSLLVLCATVVRPARGANAEPVLTYDAVTGWATVVLALVTAVLALYTYRLWRETKILREDASKEAKQQSENTSKALAISAMQTDILIKQKEIARQEFFATHRPKIIMRNASVDVHQGEYNLLYSLVNVGGSDATITESWVMTEFVDKERPIRNLRSTGHDDLGQVELKAGEARDFTYDLDDDAHLQIAFEEVQGKKGRSSVGFYFTGSVRYEDPMGTPRTAVFRRIYQDGAFRRMDDPDLEYSD